MLNEVDEVGWGGLDYENHVHIKMLYAVCEQQEEARKKKLEL